MRVLCQSKCLCKSRTESPMDPRPACCWKRPIGRDDPAARPAQCRRHGDAGRDRAGRNLFRRQARHRRARRPGAGVSGADAVRDDLRRRHGRRHPRPRSRARSARRRRDAANRLAWHAVCDRARARAAHRPSAAARRRSRALRADGRAAAGRSRRRSLYSNLVFAGAVPLWLLQFARRGHPRHRQHVRAGGR